MSEAEERKNKRRGEDESIPTASFSGSEDGPGGQIGPYKLLSILGEGGFGVVYLAEQQKPVKRRVALKIIKPGMDSKQVIARFEAEEQALALLDHPNVAQVYEAGMTKAGRPYFVMECVKGVSITEYCDREKLSIEGRLKLFLQVCEGLQHAHQKGVIHRDIKPSNILVFVQEKKVIPKIIDFGVAKAISQPLTERTLFTEQGQLVGTPEYMSPEQAESSRDIDTRTDIYSLGVLLYELLTGVLPFAAETLREGGFEHIRHVIREEEPKTPSTRLSRLGDEESTKLAQRRRTEVSTLRRRLRGDLDWITLKAMEKDRTRRYTSAAELTADIRHHLNHEPVLASPPSTVYRMKKFVRRHRTSVIAAAVVVAAVLVGFVVSSTMYLQAEQARKREAAARAEAVAVTDFLTNDLLASVDPAKAKGREVTVREVLDAASEKIEGKFEDAPLVEAYIRRTLGNTYLNLGKYEAAEPHLEGALEIRQEQLGEEDPSTLHSMDNLAVLYLERAQYEKAEPLFIKALEGGRRVLGEEHPDTLNSMNNLAVLYYQQGRYDEAEPLYVKTLETSRRVLGEEHPSTLAAMSNLGRLYVDHGRYDEAEAFLIKRLEIQRRVLGEEHPDTLQSMNNLGWFYYRQRRYDEAEPLLVKALEGRRRVLGEEHPSTLISMDNLALLYGAQGRYDEAEPLHLKALEIQRRVLGEEHPDTLVTMTDIAQLYEKQGRYEEAEALYVKTLEMRRRVLGEEHPDTLRSMRDVAKLYINDGQYDKAESLLVEALEVSRRVLGEDHPDTLISMQYLASLYHAQRRFKEAEPLFVKTLEGRRRLVGEEHPDTLDSMSTLAYLYLQQDRYDEAEALLVKALEIARRVQGEQHPGTVDCRNILAMLYLEQGRKDEAETLYVKALERGRRVQGEEHPDTLESMNNLADLYWEQGRWDDAEPLYFKTLEIRRRVLCEEDPDTIESMNNLACTYLEQGRYDEAEPLFIKALETCRQVLGKDDPATLDSMSGLADLYSRQGRYEKAELLLIEAVETRRRVLGEEHTDTQAVRKKLVELYEAWGKPLLFKLRASTPQPPDGAVVTVASTRELNWLSGKNATEHKVYFGTDSNELAFLAEVTSPNYAKFPALEKDTVYYWRIDEVQADGSVVGGNVWSFGTAGRLVGWWKFDEGSGTISSDSAGENNGTIHGAEWTTGQVGGALDFDGTDDYVSLGYIGDFAALTISLWVNIDSLPNIFNSLLHCDGWSSGDVHFMILNDGCVRFSVNGSYIRDLGSANEKNLKGIPSAFEDQDSSYAFTSGSFGQWHHIAAVYDSIEKTMDFYIDGQLDVQRFYSSTSAVRLGPLRIAGWDSPPGDPFAERCFKGLIDDVRIYNYALTETEVAAICAGEEPEPTED